MGKINHELRNRRSRLEYNRRVYGSEIDIRTEQIHIPPMVSPKKLKYPPKLKFSEKGNTLMVLIEHAGIDGGWRWLGDQQQFRSYDGGILNWWPWTGTVNFQGKRNAAWEIYDAITRSNPESGPVRKGRAVKKGGRRNSPSSRQPL